MPTLWTISLYIQRSPHYCEEEFRNPLLWSYFAWTDKNTEGMDDNYRQSKTNTAVRWDGWQPVGVDGILMGWTTTTTDRGGWLDVDHNMRVGPSPLYGTHAQPKGLVSILKPSEAHTSATSEKSSQKILLLRLNAPLCAANWRFCEEKRFKRKNIHTQTVMYQTESSIIMHISMLNLLLLKEQTFFFFF